MEDGTAITEVSMMAVTGVVRPNLFQWVHDIQVDLDGSCRDASTLQLLRTLLLLAKVRSYIKPSACLSPTILSPTSCSDL